MPAMKESTQRTNNVFFTVYVENKTTPSQASNEKEDLKQPRVSSSEKDCIQTSDKKEDLKPTPATSSEKAPIHTSDEKEDLKPTPATSS